ncbi:hypothetical protein [Alistipes sp. ZOR0009]|uniref:hypothetical protein n=1 Tax=Alistipes sp. ZOR0009 TaxID=1339253 RepID=UPI0012E06C5B|nr:hypothetical protein [Alistipes sp. ZOR0009]
MRDKLRRILSDWHFARILYLVMGLTSLGFGLYQKDAMYNLVGILFLVQAIFNISLCGAGGCGVSQSRRRFDAPLIKVKEYKPKE